MIDSSLVLQKTSNEFLTHMGIDSPEYAISKDHFERYSKLVVYQFNSLGYRDAEWPEDLDNLIWCIGDSFTLGLGQQYDETWPQIVQKMLTCRVINVSMNGASNDWIARRAKFILSNFNPKVLLIQWSFIHRREHPNDQLLDEDRALNFNPDDNNDVENLIKNLNEIEMNKNKSKVIYSFIPNFLSKDDDPETIYQIFKDQNINFFPPPAQTDFSRDGFHYDVETATQYARLYIEQIEL